MGKKKIILVVQEINTFEALNHHVRKTAKGPGHLGTKHWS